MNREAIATALFNLVKTAPGLVTSSRRLKHWSDVPTAEQPALFQAQGKEVLDTSTQKLGGPAVHRLNFEIYLYVKSTDPLASPATVLNPLLDAVEAALTPTLGTKQTLGGLAQHAFISGSIETDEGTLGDQAVAIIPVEVLAV